MKQNQSLGKWSVPLLLRAFMVKDQVFILILWPLLVKHKITWLNAMAMPNGCKISLHSLLISELISARAHNSRQNDTRLILIHRPYFEGHWFIWSPNPHYLEIPEWLRKLSSFVKHLIMLMRVSFSKCFLCWIYCQWLGTSLILSFHRGDYCLVKETDKCTPQFFLTIAWMEQEKVSLGVENTGALEVI